MKIAFLGDIAVFENELLNNNWKQGLKEVRDVLKKYDLVIANLETPLTNRKRTMTCKGIHLKSSSKVIEILKYLNVGLVCLANNHICDFGKKGMNDTISLLERESINYFGVNNKTYSYDNGNNQLIFGGFCCYSTNGTNYIGKISKSGVNTLTKKNIIKILDLAKDNHKMCILSLHWGDEYSRYANDRQISLMHQLSKKYSFILHGHHAHAMQAVEKYDDSILAYNLGNFCFDDCTSPINKKIHIKQSDINKESFILDIEINNNIISCYKTIGILYDDYKIKIIDNSNKVLFLKKKLKECNEESYKNESQKMISEQKKENLSKHDIKWFLSKINYYSIGAKILSYKNKFLYKKSY